MNALQRLGARLLGIKGISTGRAEVAAWQNNKPVYSSFTLEKAVREGYKKNLIVYACVRKIAESLGSVPWQAMQSKGNVWNEILDEEHPLKRLVKTPNANMTRRFMAERLVLHLLLTGNAIQAKLKADGEMRFLYPITPDVIKPVMSRKDYIAGYLYERNGEKLSFKPDEIVQWMIQDPSNPFWGLSPLEVGGKVVDLSIATTDWNVSAMQNRGGVDGILSFKQTLDDKSYKNAREAANRDISGRKNARKILVLDREAQFQKTASDPAEFDFPNAHKMTREDIFMLFGTPPVVMGIFEDATLANAEASHYMFWTNTVIPLLESVMEIYDLKLVETDFGSDFWLKPDLSNVPALQPNFKTLSEAAQRFWQMGVPFHVINQRLELGFDRFDGDEESKPSQSTTLSTEASKGSGPPETKVSKRVQFWKARDDQRTAFEERVAEQIGKLLKSEGSSVANAFRSNGMDAALSAVKSNESKWTKTLNDTYSVSIEHFGSMTFGELTSQKANAFTVATNRIKDFIKTTVGKHVTGISQTSRKTLRKVIGDAVSSGLSSDKVARAIKDKYEEWSTGRAYTIARTELGAAANFGHREGALQAGDSTGLKVRKEWIASGDDRVRDSHNDVDGEKRKIDEAYSNGLMYPNDPNADAGEIVNCRCVESYSLGK